MAENSVTLPGRPVCDAGHPPSYTNWNTILPDVATATQIIEHRHTTAKDNDVKVKVTKAATKEGSYGWEITYEGGSVIGTIDTITAADTLLRARFTNG